MPQCSHAAVWALPNLFSYRPNYVTSFPIAKELHVLPTDKVRHDLRKGFEMTKLIFPKVFLDFIERNST